jgi:hypothetical protein
MNKSTHCEANLLCGDSWASAKVTGSFSGTPKGVIEMLFAQLCRESPRDAGNLLDALSAELESRL